MKRHITIEQLSAYLDSALGFVEMRELESHFEACGECNARLTSMRRVVSSLGRVERAAPPPALAQQIRRQAADLPVRRDWSPLGVVRGFFELAARGLFELPLQPQLRTSAAMGLAFVVSLFLVLAQPEKVESKEVETYEGDAAPLGVLSKQTTSEVAGRKFVWTEDGWVQRGLEGEEPEALVDAGSPRGRALLARYSGLKDLLADGSPVVLRYNLETVELRNGQVLGFEVEPVLLHPEFRVLIV